MSHGTASSSPDRPVVHGPLRHRRTAGAGESAPLLGHGQKNKEVSYSGQGVLEENSAAREVESNWKCADTFVPL